MANRPAFMTLADAARIFKAAKSAGYNRTKMVSYPDGRREVVAEIVTQETIDAELSSEWDEVLRGNA